MSKPQPSSPEEYHTEEELLPLVYDALKRVAAARLRGEVNNVTLQPTALVHEAWLRISKDDEGGRWRDETQFFSAAAEAMRRILVDRARQRRTVKHGGEFQFVEWEEPREDSRQLPHRILEVNEILDRFAGVDCSAAEVVKLRYFVGMTTTEAARALGKSERTVRRQWQYAKAWLAHELT